MQETPKTQLANLFINERGFVYADGAKICRLTPEGELEFLNKGHRDSRKRGSVVVVKPANLLRLARLAQQTNPEDSK